MVSLCLDSWSSPWCHQFRSLVYGTSNWNALWVLWISHWHKDILSHMGLQSNINLIISCIFEIFFSLVPPRFKGWTLRPKHILEQKCYHWAIFHWPEIFSMLAPPRNVLFPYSFPCFTHGTIFTGCIYWINPSYTYFLLLPLKCTQTDPSPTYSGWSVFIPIPSLLQACFAYPIERDFFQRAVFL